MHKRIAFVFFALILGGLVWRCEHFALDPESLKRYQIAYISGVQLWAINDDSSSPHPLAGGTGTGISSAHWSPDGSRFAFIWERDSDNEIYVADADGGNLTQLTRHRGFDSRNLTWSPDGSQIAFNSNETGNLEIYVMSSSGENIRRLTFNGQDDVSPKWSPNGQYILFVSYFIPGSEIFIVKPDGSGLKQLTHANGLITNNASWSYDGSKIVFSSYQSGEAQIYVMNADGTQETQLTRTPLFFVGQLEWAPKALQILFTARTGPSGDEIYQINADGSGLKKLPLPSGYYHGLTFSPNGKSLAYAAYDNSGEVYQVFVMQADGRHLRQITFGGRHCVAPSWSPKNL